MFNANVVTSSDVMQEGDSLFGQGAEHAVSMIQKQAGEAVHELAISQDILGQDSLFDDPLDILFYDE